MNGLRGFIAGTIAVASAEVLLTAPGVAGRIGGLGDFLGVVIDRVVNPDVPAVGPANWTAPEPVSFGGSTTTTPSTPKVVNAVLHSTKAKPPKASARTLST